MPDEQESTRLDATVQLLSRYRAGDAEALNALYARYFDRVRAVVRLRMGPRLRAKMESSDVVQDAFVSSLRSLGDFSHRSEGAFFHWLCAIAQNRLRDHAGFFAAQKRDAAREQRLEVRGPSSESVFGPIAELAGDATPSAEAVRAEELARLEQAVDALPEAQREALLMVRYEGLSWEEAAEEMGRSTGAVRMLVARAMVALGNELKRWERREPRR